MALETGTYIDDLVTTNPDGDTDPVSDLDGHVQLIKTTIKNTFPNIDNACTATPAELNIIDGVTSTTAELNILDGVTSTTAELNILDGVTSTTAELNILDGVTSTATNLNLLSGAASTVVQQKYTLYTTQTSGTTAFPHDDTTPQNTEGDEYFTVAITPKSASNLLKIEVLLHVSTAASAQFPQMALFQDSTAGALSSANVYIPSTSTIQPMTIVYWMAAGTTSATTFKVRAGPTTAGTLYVNRSGVANLYNDTIHSSITVTEYTP